MSPLDRLLAEAVPDGTFGGARTKTKRKPGPDPKAAEHRAALEAAIRRPRTPAV
ncbi:hypothetical protein ABZ135_34690 [Streptomyces sp. NPDC006339]|uniref:hypothetical protein n=1 Tax=Streptomyces sp. NPDC006339 TaxID=3156755 RepID=UPI0033A00AAD